MPTGLSLCLTLDDAGLHLNQLVDQEQGPAPIYLPMKLHRSVLFASSRVFASPVLPALLPGSPRIDGFHVLIIGLPQGREQDRVSKEQIHQLGSQLSSTPYYADSPKCHETVIIEKIKRTPYVGYDMLK